MLKLLQKEFILKSSRIQSERMGTVNHMKDLYDAARHLVWLTQFGLSVVLPPAVPGHRAQSTFFCRGDIAVVVGIRKIRAKGIVIFAGFPQKLCRPTVSIS